MGAQAPPSPLERGWQYPYLRRMRSNLLNFINTFQYRNITRIDSTKRKAVARLYFFYTPLRQYIYGIGDAAMGFALYYFFYTLRPFYTHFATTTGQFNRRCKLFQAWCLIYSINCYH